MSLFSTGSFVIPRGIAFQTNHKSLKINDSNSVRRSFRTNNRRTYRSDEIFLEHFTVSECVRLTAYDVVNTKDSFIFEDFASVCWKKRLLQSTSFAGRVE